MTGANQRIWMAAAVVWASAMAFIAVPQTSFEIKFGVLVAGSDGQVELVETTRVPNVVGQTYGWIATIARSAQPTAWSEELKLPRPPTTWEAAAAISDDRTIARTRGIVPPGETELSSFWEITPGDPSGPYSVLVKVSDGVVADFTFEVVDP